ncbi:MAG TPA: GNAT family N-acetyltransferase [Anaerolineales bacterium]|nr:GNAT family N-acetyltransferase [Anaerolineales bacterium]
MQLPTPHGLISLRQSQPADAEEFRLLRLEALLNHPEAFSADYHFNVQQPVTYWVGRLRSLESQFDLSARGTIYFAEHGDHLIGMCGVQRGDSPKTLHTAWIWGVYVSESWRGLRIADALIDQCAQWAAAHAVTSLKLGVATHNTSAIRCYTRCGFTVYGVEPQAIYNEGKMIDELLMVHYLDQ